MQTPQGPKVRRHHLLTSIWHNHVLSLMFNHALDSGVLFRALLGSLGRICHLKYANDLLVMTAWEIKNLRIIMLILYLFEGLSWLTINFHKTNIFSVSTSQIPTDSLAQTLNCTKRSLRVTYLGVPYLVENRNDKTHKR